MPVEKNIEKILYFGPPLTYFDERTFTEMVKKVSVSNTAIEFELINGMKLSEERTEKWKSDICHLATKSQTEKQL